MLNPTWLFKPPPEVDSARMRKMGALWTAIGIALFPLAAHSMIALIHDAPHDTWAADNHLLGSDRFSRDAVSVHDWVLYYGAPALACMFTTAGTYRVIYGAPRSMSTLRRLGRGLVAVFLCIGAISALGTMVSWMGG